MMIHAFYPLGCSIGIQLIVHLFVQLILHLFLCLIVHSKKNSKQSEDVPSNMGSRIESNKDKLGRRV